MSVQVFRPAAPEEVVVYQIFGARLAVTSAEVGGTYPGLAEALAALPGFAPGHYVGTTAAGNLFEFLLREAPARPPREQERAAGRQAKAWGARLLLLDDEDD